MASEYEKQSFLKPYEGELEPMSVRGKLIGAAALSGAYASIVAAATGEITEKIGFIESFPGGVIAKFSGFLALCGAGAIASSKLADRL